MMADSDNLSGARGYKTSAGGWDPAFGTVYCAVTSSRPGQIKIGATTMPTRQRIQKFRTKYNLPDVAIIFSMEVSHPARVEAAAQQSLRTNRVSGKTTGESNEWYKVSALKAALALAETAVMHGEKIVAVDYCNRKYPEVRRWLIGELPDSVHAQKRANSEDRSVAPVRAVPPAARPQIGPYRSLLDTPLEVIEAVPPPAPCPAAPLKSEMPDTGRTKEGEASSLSKPEPVLEPVINWAKVQEASEGSMAKAMREYESGNVERNVWLHAVREGKGNTISMKLHYLRDRVAQLEGETPAHYSLQSQDGLSNSERAAWKFIVVIAFVLMFIFVLAMHS